MQNIRRTQMIFSALLEENPFPAKGVDKEAHRIISKMFEHNPNFDPDTLARATFFFVCTQSERLSTEQVRRIRENGAEENSAWPKLLPIISSVMSR
jgi:hypothetical protein